MPAITSYLHGLTASMYNMSGNPNPPKRGKVTGWSSGAARRNTNFLRSVDETQLDGYGLAATLTIRDCPPSAKAWANLIQAWMKRQARAGMVRLHWVTEFQRRGVPHLHAAIWFPDRYLDESDYHQEVRLAQRFHRVSADWIDLAKKYGAGRKGQQVRLIDGAVGWFQYMAKHCSRSKKHYQRQQSSLPEEWQSTGRVWGHRGEWVTRPPIVEVIDKPTYFRLRRLVKRARIAEARAGLPLNAKQVGFLRRLLKSPERKASETRPISEWMSQERQVQLLRAAYGQVAPEVLRNVPAEAVAVDDQDVPY